MEFIDAKDLKKVWRADNFDMGISLGYPECCVEEFCKNDPETMYLRGVKSYDRLKYKMAHIDGEYTGFIPCKKHARMISRGKASLESLLNQRNTDYKPFPLETTIV